jgi:outer membrane protein OmpA-like peptidoglycan-associated protein
MRTVALLVAISFAMPPARPAQAQFLKRVTERVKEKAVERKLQAEESVLTRAAEPADSVMTKVAAPVESLAARVGGGAGAAVGRIGRDGSQSEDEARLRQELASGRAALPAVQFEPGTSAIVPASEPSLRALLAVMTGSPNVFLIQGRADPASPPASAADLAVGRANAVKAWLVANGIPGPQVFAAGEGAAAADAPLVTIVSMQ